MKHNIAAYIIILIVAVLCGTAVFAQAGQDDHGQTNDPRSNARANACYPEGSLAGACVTEAQWDCGWSLIRFEYGLLTSLPTDCASLFPNITTSSGQNPFLSVTAFDANAMQDPPASPDNDCVWSWATQFQPTLRDEVLSAAYAAGLSVTYLTVTTYGENCLNKNGEFVRFAAQYTAFDVSVIVPTNSSESEVQAAMSAVFQSLNNIPGSSSPQFSIQLETAEPTAIPSVTPDPYPSCVWMWARQPQSDLAQKAGAAIGAAGYTASVNAYLYGEDCNTREGQFVYFAVMDTNFDVTVTVDANINQSTVYQAVNTAIRGLSGMPTSKVNINVSFVTVNPAAVPALLPIDVAAQAATPEANPEIDLTTPEVTAPTEEATVMPTATPQTGLCTENC